MDVFAADNVTILECVSLHCDLPPENAFNLLVAKNSFLRTVNIRIDIQNPLPEDFSDTTILERFHDIINCFMSSSSLQSLEIDVVIEYMFPHELSPAYFAPVCETVRTRYRHRRVDIRISREDFCCELRA